VLGEYRYSSMHSLTSTL